MTTTTRRANPVPHDPGDEAVLLGAALINQQAAELVATQTTAADFYVPLHQRIQEAISTLVAAGLPVDVATVASDLARRNGVADLSTAKKELHVLLVGCPAAANAAAYLKSVHEWSWRRRAQVLASELAQVARGEAGLAELKPALEEFVNGPADDSALDDRLVEGGSFVANGAQIPRPLHGHNDEVLHADGEPTFVVGRTGLGKSTYAQNYLLHRVGVRTEDWLGLPVAPLPIGHSILYVAADRPRQVQRSLRRMVADLDLPILDEALLFWRGPLPFLLNHDPLRLAAFVAAIERQAGVQIDEVILDSLKDVAADLAKDEGGSAVAIALARLIADNREVMVLHHERKAERAVKRAPGSIDDIYGSQFLGACAGNVIYLYGEPGAHVLTLHHLKQSADQIGPLTLRHDHGTGRLDLDRDAPNLVGELRKRPQGTSARDACLILFDDPSPTTNSIEKARRRLEKLVQKGQAWKTDAKPPNPSSYFACESRYGEESE
jgi:replicative DNA helicase